MYCLQPEYVYSSWPIDYWLGHVQRFTTTGNIANTDTFVRQWQKPTLETNKLYCKLLIIRKNSPTYLMWVYCLRPEYVYSSWPIDYWLGHVQRLTRLVSLIKGMGCHASYQLPVEMQSQRKQLFPTHYISASNRFSLCRKYIHRHTFMPYAYI